MDDSDSDSIPDPEINFALVYAFHTFVATVDGQASVMRGDSLVLLDDANSYWWLVRVLKTDEVGYIPAENVETPWERLARLNKWRNVELGHATGDEMAEAMTYEQDLRGGALLSRFDPRESTLFSAVQSPPLPPGALSRRKSVVFAPPTYVDHPGVTWSDESDADDEQGRVEDELAQDTGDEDSDDDDDDNRSDTITPRDISHIATRVSASPEIHPTTHHQSFAAEVETTPLDAEIAAAQPSEMEPDDGIAWSDAAAQEYQQRVGGVGASQQNVQPTEARVLTSTPTEELGQGPAAKYGALGIARGPSSISGAPSIPRETTPDDIMDALGRPSPLANQRASPVPSAGETTSRSVPSPSPSSHPRIASATSQASAYSYASTTTTTTTTSESTRSNSVSPDMSCDPASRKNKREAGARKKRSGVFSGLFKKKDKREKSTGTTPAGQSDQAKFIESQDTLARGSGESFVNSPQGIKASSASQAPRSPLVTANARPDRPAITLSTPRPTDRAAATAAAAAADSPSQSSPSAISPHALRLQQLDQQQHRRYQEYMARSPSNDQLEPASAAAGSYAAQQLVAASGGQGGRESSGSIGSTRGNPGPAAFLPNGRPGSLVLHSSTGSAPSLRGGELTVLRVFVGDTVVSENTFKTVLTNETTSAKRLVQQAVQRLQLPTEDDYYLVIKQVEGEQVELTDNDKVLERFFALNGNTEDDDPALGPAKKTIRRSSIGSISSISSNLSQHPAISRLAMNDFSDDSSVKLFLHRRTPQPPLSSQHEHEQSGPTTPTRSKPFPHLGLTANVATSSPNSMATGSPTPRFSLQIVISAHDLPDGMTFDPQSSESIVSKSWLSQHRASAGFSHDHHGREHEKEIHKLLLIPTNATVAEVIEAGLERFGIVGGVVAGGDDVEDKVTKRRSVMRIQYGLAARFPEQTEEMPLQPNHKVLDAYRAPPVFKSPQMSKEMRRRSREFPGASQDDIQPTDPVLVLRRVPTNLPDSPKVALDEVEVRRRRMSVDTNSSSPGRPVPQAKTTQQIIEEQRALSRAKQHALLSAQENTENGLDVHLPDKGTVRSSRITIDGEEHVRYSYISIEGETIDISKVVQNELAAGDRTAAENDPEETLLSPMIPGFSRQPTDQSVYRTAPNTPLPDDESIKSKSSMSFSLAKPDLLQRAIQHSSPDNASDIANRLDRIIGMATSFHEDDDMNRLTPVPFERAATSPPLSSTALPNRATSPSESEIGRILARDASLSPILGSAPASIKQAMDLPSRMQQGQVTPKPIASVQPLAQTRFVPRAKHQRQQPSIASILSDISVPNRRESSTAMSLSPISGDLPTPFGKMSAATEALREPLDKPHRPIKHKDDFGFTTMMHVIQARADKMRSDERLVVTVEAAGTNEVERRYLGREATGETSPPVQKRFSSIDQKLEEQERELSSLMEGVLAFALESSGKRAVPR